MRGLRLGLIIRQYWGLSQFLVQPSALTYTVDLEQLPAAATPEQQNTDDTASQIATRQPVALSFRR